MKHSIAQRIATIAALYAFRMLGLFMLIPVFTLYAPRLDAATPTLIGIALGAYGLSQGLLQLPFGRLSDSYGRKKIIQIGLVLFIGGSLWGAVAHSIYSIIGARILQGSGAIGSVLMALLADQTPPEHRAKAMAVIGGTIGASFGLAILISPPLANKLGLQSVFYLSAILGCVGLYILHRFVPNAPPLKKTLVSRHYFYQLLKQRTLQHFNVGIFCQHMILTATFYVLPMQLHQAKTTGLLQATWHFYLPIMIGSFLFMLPCLMWAEKKHCMKLFFLGAVSLISLGQWGLASSLSQSWWLLLTIYFLYFIAFNFLEAALPALISLAAPSEAKGTTMGIYSTCQFLGIFVGGSVAGVLYAAYGQHSIFIFNGVVALVWLVFSGVSPFVTKALR